ncbi:MAG: hypothetical protein AB1476_04485 [Candidatus Hadarchaeota archaeon]
MSRSNSKSLTKLVVVLVMAATVAGAVAVFQPWKWINSGGTVRFYTKASFYLQGTEDNGQLENVTIYFPDLTISDNKILNRDYIKNADWNLYAYVDNQLVTEIRGMTVLQLVAPRTSELVIPSMGYNTSLWGPKYSFSEMDRIYPGETLQIELWWEVPASIADKITLRDFNPSFYPTTSLIYYNTPGKRINASFFSGLYRIDENYRILQVVEQFSRTENGLGGVWWELSAI